MSNLSFLEALQPNPSKILQSTPSELRNCRVYAFHMNPTAWCRKALRRANPAFDYHARLTTEPLYVGETSKSIEQRFKDHCNPNVFTSTQWGVHHFKSDFHQAFDRAIRTLRKTYGHEFGVNLDALTREEARQHEKGFGLWLRRRGYAVHFA